MSDVRETGAGPAGERASEPDGEPEISVGGARFGRETMAAIVADLGESGGAPRVPLETIAFDPSATDVAAARVAVGPPPDEAPAFGRATLASIEEDLLRPPPASVPALHAAEVFEVATFVVQGDTVLADADDDVRRRFVATRLRHRLHVLSLDDVAKIEVLAGVEPGMSILRVWCRVASARV